MHKGSPPKEKTKKRIKKKSGEFTWLQCLFFWLVIIFVVAISLMIVVIVQIDSGLPSHLTGAIRSIQDLKDRHREVANRFNHKKYAKVSYKSQQSPNIHDISEKLKIAKVSGNHAWYLANTTLMHEGKQVQALHHFLLDPHRTTHKVITHGTPDGCAPTFLQGAVLQLPSSGYSIYTQSITALDVNFAVTAFDEAVAIWDSLAIQPLLGSRRAWVGGAPDLSSTDGINSVSYGSISEPGVLGYTIMWGFFDQYPVDQRALIEWDIVFGDASNALGDATLNPNVYDYPRICVHELGHAHGFFDDYIAGCQASTIMYGYSPRGLVYPRVPQQDDIDVFYQMFPQDFNSNGELPSTFIVTPNTPSTPTPTSKSNVIPFSVSLTAALLSSLF
jgi:hypothetical protein